MKLRRMGIALAAVAALTLSACGSDDDTGGEGGDAGTSQVEDTADAGSQDTAGASSEDTADAGGQDTGSASSEDTGSAEGSEDTGSAEGSEGTGGAGEAADSKVLGDAESGTLTIGIKFDQPGLGLKNPDGSYSGFDIDVARYVAEQLGVDEDGITFVQTKSAEREDKIAKGEVDFIVATYSITDERSEKVNFAGPYFIAHQDLLVRADESEITGPEAMNGKILCSVTGSTSAQKVKEDYAKDVALQEFGTYSECVEQLKAGVVDAVTTDDVILAGYAAEEPGAFKVVGNGFSDENYGIGLMKDDQAGTDAINAAIKSMIDDGSWQASLEENVGPSGYEIPEPPTQG